MLFDCFELYLSNYGGFLHNLFSQRRLTGTLNYVWIYNTKFACCLLLDFQDFYYESCFFNYLHLCIILFYVPKPCMNKQVDTNPLMKYISRAEVSSCAQDNEARNWTVRNVHNTRLYKQKHTPLRLVPAIFNFKKQVFRDNPFQETKLERQFEKKLEKVHIICKYISLQQIRLRQVSAYLV